MADVRLLWHQDTVKLSIPGLLVLLSLVACGGSEPDPIALPTAAGVPYRVLVTTFNDGAYADQPFHLLLESKGAAGDPKTVLRAEQCKNVHLAQTPHTLYVFYDELMLNGFSSFRYEAHEPRVLLCDVQTPECAATRLTLTSRGAKLSNVCTYKTKAAT